MHISVICWAGPRLDWDPDIVAGLDEDFNYDDPDNQLDDNFMDMANEEMEEGQECEKQGSLERWVYYYRAIIVYADVLYWYVVQYKW